MWNWKYFAFMALGVAISVVLPLIRRRFHGLSKRSRTGPASGIHARTPYVATALFSLLVAALLMAYLGATITSWTGALLAGYTCDSTLQKLATGNMAPKSA